MKKLLSTVVLIFASGCASQSPSGDPLSVVSAPIKEKNSRLVIIRPTGDKVTSRAQVRIKLDEEEQDWLSIGRYLVVETESGKHVVQADIAVTPGECRVEVNTQPGEVVFFEVRERKTNTLAGFVGSVGGSALGVPFGDVVGKAVGSGAESAFEGCGGQFSIAKIDESSGKALLSNNLSKKP